MREVFSSIVTNFIFHFSKIILHHKRFHPSAVSVMSERNVQVGPQFCVPLSEKSLGEQLFDSLIRNRNRDLFIDAITCERVSYGYFLEATCKLAQCFKNAGIKANDIITISSENSQLFFQPVAAALYLGVIVAPINHSYIEDELLYALNLTKPKYIFCSKAVVAKFVSAQNKCQFIKRIIVLDLNEKLEGVESLQNFVTENCDSDYNKFKPTKLNVEDHLAAILCSSGTTGLPKGVMITHNNMNVQINHVLDPRLSTALPGAAKLGLMPFFHGFGFVATLSSMIIGEKIIVLRRFDENLFLASIQDYKIAELWIAPPLAVFLAKSPLVNNYDLSCVKEIVCGAAPLGKELDEEVKQRLQLKCIRQAYGLSESTSAVILMPPDEDKPGSSGIVTPGMSVKVRDPESGVTLGPHKTGELCIKGPKVTKGYYNNPKATKETFMNDGWLLSGDLGYFDEEGYFFIVDRLKELIKYKGFQVAPAELEALLLRHPKIKEAAVVGLPDELAGELPLAFVVKQPNAELTEEEVKKFVKENVSYTKQLRGGVRFIDSIPKNQTGKILRRDLRLLLKGSP